MPHVTCRPFTVVSAVVPMLFAAGLAHASPDCSPVQGHLEETLVTAGACNSPVGLCTVAQMFGTLRGEARFTASAFIQSADTPTTSVILVIGDTTLVDARLGGKHGTLSIKNAAAFRVTGNGDLADVQTIVGGTGDFAGASGSLRISGNFVGTEGSSAYEGTVCIE